MSLRQLFASISHLPQIFSRGALTAKVAFVGAVGFGVLVLITGGHPLPAEAAPAAKMPAPLANASDPAPGLQTAVLSGGCFWGVQAVFQHVNGVTKVLAGYSGGKKDTAQYETVSTGTTGHAESVEITFDPTKVSYGEILRVFFSVALDPTELNFQGPDYGTQYRSEIFYNSDAQKKIAQDYIAQLDEAHVFGAPIVTRVDPKIGFYPAEDYHQDYLVNNPGSMYIVINDVPKVNNLKRLLPEDYHEDPTLVFPKKAMR